MTRAAADALDVLSIAYLLLKLDLLSQSLKALLEASGQGLKPLLLELHPHHAPVLQAIQHIQHHEQQQHEQQQHGQQQHGQQQHEQQQQQDLDSASAQPPAIQRFLAMAADIDQLQELLLRLLQRVSAAEAPTAFP
jgi:hypothetical protein